MKRNERATIAGALMRRPKDADDYSQCVKRNLDMTWVWCVECNAWHTPVLVGMAKIKINYNRIIDWEIDDSSVVFECSQCGADISYLLQNHRAELIADMA